MIRKLLFCAALLTCVAADWCPEHGVPESICTRCNPSLVAKFKKKGDWCAEHNLPESQCVLCNPSLKEKFAAMAPKDGAPAHDDHDHAQHKQDDHDHGEHKHDDHDHGEHTDEVKLSAEAIERYGVRVAPVGKHTLSSTFVVPARVTFNGEAMAHVGTVVEGRAIEVKVKIGDRVKKGDPLLIVESAALGEAQSDLLQKRTAEDVARASLEPVQAALERARKLYNQDGGVALGELQRRESEVRTAEGALRTAQAARTAAENKLHLLGMDQAAVDSLMKSSEIDPKFAIRAPLDGQVIEREVTLGELVSPEEDALLVLADTSTVWAIAAVPESRATDLQVGASARVQIGSAPPVVAAITFIAPTLDAATRTAQARVDLPNPNGAIRAGMFASIEIASSSGGGDAMVAIPNSAIQSIESNTVVFVPVEGEPNTFATRVVAVGPAVGTMHPVISGLEAGEQIVVNGTFILKAELGKSGASHGH